MKGDQWVIHDQLLIFSLSLVLFVVNDHIQYGSMSWTRKIENLNGQNTLQMRKIRVKLQKRHSLHCVSDHNIKEDPIPFLLKATK